MNTSDVDENSVSLLLGRVINNFHLGETTLSVDKPNNNYILIYDIFAINCACCTRREFFVPKLQHILSF